MLNFKNHFFSLLLLSSFFIPYIQSADQKADNLEDEANPIGDVLDITEPNPKHILHLHNVIHCLHKADPKYINARRFKRKGNTPLHTAIYKNHCPDTFTLLLLLGADTSLTNNAGESPLDVACSRDFNSQKNIVNNIILLAQHEQNNSDIVKKNNQKLGSNPFHYLMANKSILDCANLNQIMQSLERAGYDINAQDNLSLTPAHYALGYNYNMGGTLALIPLLKSVSADFTIKNRTGQDPFEWAETCKKQVEKTI